MVTEDGAEAVFLYTDFYLRVTFSFEQNRLGINSSMLALM